MITVVAVVVTPTTITAIKITIGASVAPAIAAAFFLDSLEHVGERARNQPVRLRVIVIVPVIACFRYLSPSLAAARLQLLLLLLL